VVASAEQGSAAETPAIAETQLLLPPFHPQD
jgi:hypothetical protein